MSDETEYVLLMLSSGAIVIAECLNSTQAPEYLILDSPMMLAQVQQRGMVGLGMVEFMPGGRGKFEINRAHVAAIPERIDPELLRHYLQRRSGLVLPKK